MKKKENKTFGTANHQPDVEVHFSSVWPSVLDVNETL